jgi:Fuc2NAc and GlcNAc transferase
MDWFNCALILVAASWSGVALFRWYAISRGILDKPNKRSSHSVSTPRGGGIVFALLWFVFLGTLIYFADLVDKPHWWTYLMATVPVLIIMYLGYLDDLRGLSAKTRFIGQCVAALLSLWVVADTGQSILPLHNLPVWLLYPVALVGIVWAVNLVNFMDGSDGLAATQAIFAFGVSGYFVHQLGGYELATLSWGLVCLLLGFLVWNLPTARVFMGDSGSCFLGFLMAIFALISYHWFNLPLQYWAILTAPFWFDATVTLVRRMLRGDKWQEAHREHAYQRIMLSGWSHQKVLCGSVVINCLLSALAIWAYQEPELLNLAFTLSISFIAFVYLMIELQRPMFKTWHNRA